MKISEPAAVERERAVPRRFAARSLACACLMLMALASRDLAAQAKPAPVAVTFGPGEFTKEVPMPRAATEFLITPQPYICGWPTTEQIRSRISSMNAATLNAVLWQMEGHRMGGGQQVYGQMQQLGLVVQFIGPGSANSAFFPVAVPPPSQTNISLPLLTGCLEIATALAGTMEIRRIIRAYLGMPPPT